MAAALRAAPPSPATARPAETFAKSVLASRVAARGGVGAAAAGRKARGVAVRASLFSPKPAAAKDARPSKVQELYASLLLAAHHRHRCRSSSSPLPWPRLLPAVAAADLRCHHHHL